MSITLRNIKVWNTGEVIDLVVPGTAAAYFEQVKNGMLVRMALESTVVGDELPGYEPLNPKEVQA